MRRTGALLGLALLACVRANPAFDELDAFGDDASDESEQGDGDGDDDDDDDDEPGDGDPGDGDGEPGDGDGDGDGDPGDGDGDPGDGDGEPGDGDGDAESDTGDGDGDNSFCEPTPLDDPAVAVLNGAVMVDTGMAPGFAEQARECQVLVICNGKQELCNDQTPYVVQVRSGGVVLPGVALSEPAPIRLHFQPGKPSCGLPLLSLDPSQHIVASWPNANDMPQKLHMRLPCFEGTELDLWVAEDGSTFYDKQLTEPAATW